MKTRKKRGRKRLIQVMETANTDNVSELCEKANVSRVTFYMYLNKDREFKRVYLRIKERMLMKELSTLAA